MKTVHMLLGIGDDIKTGFLLVGMPDGCDIEGVLCLLRLDETSWDTNTVHILSGLKSVT